MDLTIDISFLNCDHSYLAKVISDGMDAWYDIHPTDFSYHEETVKSDGKMLLQLAPGGGEAVHFIFQGK
jgi:hypothetical protein